MLILNIYMLLFFLIQNFVFQKKFFSSKLELWLDQFQLFVQTFAGEEHESAFSLQKLD